MRNRLLAILIIAGSAADKSFAADNKITAGERLDAAAEALTDVMTASDKGIPQALLDQARCVIVVPRLKRTLPLFGAKNGSGFAACRRRDGKGWSAPAAVRMEGGKRQGGGPGTDIVFFAMSDGGMKHLLADKFTVTGVAAPRLGRDVVCGGVVTTRSHCATATAGPVGRDLSAETDAMKNAEILSWSHSRGLMEGSSTEGATLRPDEETNKELYGGDPTNREILTGAVKAPAAAEKFARALSRDSAQPAR